MPGYSIQFTEDVLIFFYKEDDPTGAQYQELLDSLTGDDTLTVFAEVAGVKVEFTIPASKKNNVKFRKR